MNPTQLSSNNGSSGVLGQTIVTSIVAHGPVDFQEATEHTKDSGRMHTMRRRYPRLFGPDRSLNPSHVEGWIKRSHNAWRIASYGPTSTT